MLSFSRFRSVLAALLLGWSAAALPAATWLKLETDEVVIYSDAGPKDVVEFSVGFAAFQHAFVKMFGPHEPLPPTRVILFKRPSLLQEHLPAPDKAGREMISFSAEVDGVPLAAFAVGSDRQTALERAYEFQTIWGLVRAGYALPIWASQGAGEVMASLRVTKTGYELGDGPEAFDNEWRRFGGIAWADFFNIHTASDEYSGWKASGQFHAQAWALMHRVLLADGDGRARFDALAAKLRNTLPQEAVESVLGIPVKDLEREVDRYIRRDTGRLVVPFDAAALRQQRKPQPAPEVEVHLVLGDLLLLSGKVTESQEHLAAAEALAPDSALVKEARARAVARTGDMERAAELYREAIAAGSRNPYAYLFSARRRVDEGRSGSVDHAGSGGRDIEVAASELRQAIALNPTYADAYRLLGHVLFLLPTIGQEQVDELSRGLGLPDPMGTIRYSRSLLYSRLGQRDAALADLRFILNDPSLPPHAKKRVREQLTSREIEAVRATVEPLRKAGRYEDATALLKERLTEQPEPEVAAEYNRLLEVVGSSALRTDVKRLMQEGRFTDAVALVERRIAEMKNPQVVENLTEYLGWVKERGRISEIEQLHQARDWAAIVTAIEAFQRDYPNSQAANGMRPLLEAARRNKKRAEGLKD